MTLDMFGYSKNVDAYRFSWKFIQSAQRSWSTRLWHTVGKNKDIPGHIKSNRTHAWIDAAHPAVGELWEHARYLADPGQYAREQALVTPADMAIGRAAELAFQRPETLTVEVTQ
jgi:hypothetical protein